MVARVMTRRAPPSSQGVTPGNNTSFTNPTTMALVITVIMVHICRWVVRVNCRMASRVSRISWRRF